MAAGDRHGHPDISARSLHNLQQKNNQANSNGTRTEGHTSNDSNEKVVAAGDRHGEPDIKMDG